MADLSKRVNADVGLRSDRDRHAAVQTFRILYRAGYVFRRDDIEHWAIAHGWSPLVAIDLGNVAEDVNHDRAFYLLAAGPVYPEGILATWETLARR